MKATAVAPANIAFIKYWGQKNPKINLPFNNSISMNLSKCFTVTSCDFSPKYLKDEIFFEGKKIKENQEFFIKIVKHLNQVRKLAKSNFKAKVISANSFPSDAGIASSAAGFAALTLAASQALGLNLTQKELSVLARLGSGSACRSIPDGFVEWKKGKNHKSSYARSLAPDSWWEISDIVAIVTNKKKKYSSSFGHLLAPTSPYFKKGLNLLPQRIKKVKKAIKNKNLELLGQIIEEEALDLHIIAMSSNPPLFYWEGKTLEIIKKVREWRKKGLPAYFTIDAGPSVHIICEQKYEKIINKKIRGLPGVLKTIINHPAPGAEIKK